MPLTDLPTNVRLATSSPPSAVFSSPANKENVSILKVGAVSSIPVRTPSKESKASLSTPNPKLRRGHVFSKSSSDLSNVSDKMSKMYRPGYMAATTASKIRETVQDQPFAEPLTPSASGSGVRYAKNPFK